MHSTTYKYGNYTKLMQIKVFTEWKSLEIALKYTKMTKSKKTSKTRQKFDFRMKPKITTLPPKCFLIIAMQSVCCCSFPVWRRSPLEKGTPVTYFGPALDPPLGRFDPKVNSNVWGHEYFIPTKFGKYPSNDSVVKTDYVFQYIYMH